MKEFIAEYKFNDILDTFSLMATSQREAIKKLSSISGNTKLIGVRQAKIGEFINRLDYPSIH